MTDPLHRRNLGEIELPAVKGQQVDFWNNGTQYWIQADQDNAWALVRAIGGSRLLEFGMNEGQLRVFDDHEGPIPARTNDWRRLVAEHL